VATEARPLAAIGNRRVLVVVALAALVAAAAVVGATLVQTRGEHTTVPGAVTHPRAGRPRLELAFGVDTSPQALALARAQKLYNAGHVAQAAAIFRRYDSVEARIGSAFVGWKQDGLAAVQRIAESHSSSGVVLFHLGLAQYWAGLNADAVATWGRTAQLAADSPYGVKAEDLLHPTLKIPGLPYLVLDFKPPRSLRNLSPAKQLAAFARAAARPDVRAKLLYGSALWNLERPISAERQFQAAARLAPHDALARTAAAVGLFTKADPVKAFSRLGPLTGVFPKAPVVRFHLGLLLLWTGKQNKAVAQLRLAAAGSPSSSYSQDAKAFLASLASTGSK
jgi:tetratricopeptide (TPR) repeat protein